MRRAPMSGPLRIGVIPPSAHFCCRACAGAPRSLSRLKPWLREDTTARLVDRLEASRLDVVLLALPCDCGGADTVTLRVTNSWSPCHLATPSPRLRRSPRVHWQPSGCCCWRKATACANRRCWCAACWPGNAARPWTALPPPPCTPWCRWWRPRAWRHAAAASRALRRRRAWYRTGAAPAGGSWGVAHARPGMAAESAARRRIPFPWRQAGPGLCGAARRGSDPSETYPLWLEPPRPSARDATPHRDPGAPVQLTMTISIMRQRFLNAFRPP